MKHIYITAIQKILKSRKLEFTTLVRAIQPQGQFKWRVTHLVKDGQPYPDQVFEVRDGKMSWRAAT